MQFPTIITEPVSSPMIVIRFIKLCMTITTTKEFSVESGEVYSLPTSIEVNPKNIVETNNTIKFIIQAVDSNSTQAESESRFLGPLNY